MLLGRWRLAVSKQFNLTAHMFNVTFQQKRVLQAHRFLLDRIFFIRYNKFEQKIKQNGVYGFRYSDKTGEFHIQHKNVSKIPYFKIVSILKTLVMSLFILIQCYFNLNSSLCCECGTLIDSNPANMCVACLRNHVDITEGMYLNYLLHIMKSKIQTFFVLFFRYSKTGSFIFLPKL